MQRSIIAPAERVTNLRWAMAFVAGFGILIVGCDQMNLVANGAAVRQAFGLDDVSFGYILSAFGWTFLFAQLPCGQVLDAIGVARMGRTWNLVWSVVSIVAAFAATTAGLLAGARALLGVAAAPALPTSAKAIGYWFPTAERSGGTSIFDAAGKLGFAIGLPLMAYIGQTFGWRTGFLVTGLAGIVSCALFWFVYRDPAQHRGLTYAEKQHLANGGAQREGPPSGVNVILTPKVWALTIGFFAYAFAFVLLLTWLPAYVTRTFHVGTFPSALAAGVPWLIAAIVDVLVGGLLVDALIKRGTDASRARKSVLVIGMLLGLAVFGAVSAHDQTVALISIGIAIAGLGMSGPVAWSIPSLIAPAGTVGTITSLMTAGGALGAIAAPIAAGYILNATANFADVFIAAAAVLLIGIASYVFVLGRIEPLDGGEPAGLLI